MKRLTILLFTCLWAIAGHAQTNLFPADGSVGIGTLSPSWKLDVRGGGVSISGRNSLSSVNGFGNALQLRHSSHAAIVYNPGEVTELMFGFHSNGNFYWGSKAGSGNGFYCMQLNKSGFLMVRERLQVGSKAFPNYEFSVDGKMAAKEVMVTLSGWPDYVFQQDYRLRPLDELDRYIRHNGHLPGIPKANEVEANGVELGEMNKKLLEKIEELTLYIIDQHQRMDAMGQRLQQLEKKTDD